MAYNPTLPANNAPVVSAELRNQFAGLKDLIDAVPSSSTMQGVIQTIAAGSVLPVNYLNLTVSDPPTQAEVQAIATQLDLILQYLRYE